MAGKEREKQGLREAGKLETFYLMMRGGCTFGEREVSLVGEMTNFWLFGRILYPSSSSPRFEGRGNSLHLVAATK